MKQIDDDFDEEVLYEKPKAARKVAKPENPLAAYFRLPGLHVTLPTRGKFFSPENYDETLAEDIPVYPMKASDEILLKTPDALMSGFAIEKLIESCVPAIKNPREVSTPDLDVLLLAIRAATYGDSMEIEISCPKCDHINIFDCDLPSMMSTMTYVDPENEVRLTDEIIVYIKPYNLASAIKITMATYEETQKIRALEEDLPNEERTKVLNSTYSKMTTLNNEAIASSILNIAIPGSLVTNPQHILEFVNNTESNWIKKIEKKLEEINSKGIDKRIDLKCAKCDHEWESSVEFDPASFFGKGS